MTGSDLRATVIGVEIGPKNRDHRRKPSDDETLSALAARYKAGASIRLLAIETGWAYSTVHKRLSMAQSAGLLVMRPKGGARVDPSAR